MSRASLVSALALLFTAGCAVFGIRTEEEPRYAVALKEDRKEIREYQPYVLARVTAPGRISRAAFA